MKNLFIIFFLQTLLAAQSIENKDPFQTTANLEVIYFLDGNTGWAGGRSFVLRTTDSGNTWQRSDLNIDATVYEIKAFTSGILIAHTVHGSNNDLFYNSFRSTDGGANWTELILPPETEYRVTELLDESKALIATKTTIFKTFDAGAAWDIINYDSTAQGYPLLSFLDENTGWMSRGGIWKTTDGGINWQPLSSISGSTLAFFSATLGYIQVDDKIYKTTDGGLTWINIYSFPFYSEYFFISPSLIFLKFGWSNGEPFYPTVLKTTDEGVSWDTVYYHKRYAVLSIYFLNDQTGYLAGDDGYIAKTTNAQNFTSINGDYIFDVTVNGSNVLLAGEFGKTYRSSNYGEQWQNVESGTAAHIRSIDFLDNETVIAFTDSLLLLRSTDGGITWNHILTELYQISDIQIYSSSVILAASLHGNYFKSTDAGLTWIKNFFPDTLMNIYFLSDQVGYIGSKTKLYKTTDGGVNWAVVNSGYYPRGPLKFFDEQSGYGIADDFVKTSDGGLTWSTVKEDADNPSYSAAYFNSSQMYVLFSPFRLWYYPPDLLSHENFERGRSTLYYISDDQSELILQTYGYIKPGMDFESEKYGWIAAGRKVIRISDDSILTNTREIPPVPASYMLGQNYPNPFNPVTTLSYSIPQAGYVKLTVYSQLGEEAAQLVNENKEAGNYQITFDASGLTSGVYFYKIIAGDFSSIKKMMLLK